MDWGHVDETVLSPCSREHRDRVGPGLGHDQGEHGKPICFSLTDLLSDPLLWLGLERAWRKPLQWRGGGVGAGGRLSYGPLLLLFLGG